MRARELGIAGGIDRGAPLSQQSEPTLRRAGHSWPKGGTLLAPWIPMQAKGVACSLAKPMRPIPDTIFQVRGKHLSNSDILKASPLIRRRRSNSARKKRLIMSSRNCLPHWTKVRSYLTKPGRPWSKKKCTEAQLLSREFFRRIWQTSRPSASIRQTSPQTTMDYWARGWSV